VAPALEQLMTRSTQTKKKKTLLIIFVVDKDLKNKILPAS